jgi:hypothetical protein
MPRSESRLDQIRATSTLADMVEGQAQHLLILALILCGAAWLLQHTEPRGQFLGLSSLGWAWVSIWLAVAHQVIVAIVFRAQLHRGLLTRRYGGDDLKVWGLVFFPLLAARPVTLTITAWLDRGSIDLWRPGEILLGLLLIVPAVMTMRSVIRHFGFVRAMGGDHFGDEFLHMPRVREGMFRYSDNAMYSFAFLGLWGIALLCGSWQALIVALVQHAYIWVHMYCVESPDMRWLYGPPPGDRSGSA